MNEVRIRIGFVEWLKIFTAVLSASFIALAVFGLVAERRIDNKMNARAEAIIEQLKRGNYIDRADQFFRKLRRGDDATLERVRERVEKFLEKQN